MARDDDWDDPEDRPRRRSWEEDRDEWDRYADGRARRGRSSEDDRGRRRYDDFDYDREPRKTQGSSLPCVLSFILALVAGVLILGVFVAAGVLTMQAGGDLDENSPEAVFIGLGMMAGLGLALLGLILGIVGTLGDHSKKVFAYIGATLNGLILLGTVGLICAGIAVG
jgi:hypothetical protein